MTETTLAALGWSEWLAIAALAISAASGLFAFRADRRAGRAETRAERAEQREIARHKNDEAAGRIAVLERIRSIINEVVVAQGSTSTDPSAHRRMRGELSRLNAALPGTPYPLPARHRVREERRPEHAPARAWRARGCDRRRAQGARSAEAAELAQLVDEARRQVGIDERPPER